MRKLTNYRRILFFATIFFNLVACEELTAGGPGNGGTGPFLTTSDDLLVLSTHKTTHEPSVAVNSPTMTVSEQDQPTMLTIVEKSEDDAVCGNFSHTISVLSYEPNTSNNKYLDVIINNRVINNSDMEQIEIKENCTSYEVISQNSYDNHTVCDTPTEQLLFLPKQMHDYTLTLQNVTTGSYSIKYTNKVMADTDNQCTTSLNFVIK